MLGLRNIRALQWLIVLLLLVTVELNPNDKRTILWTPGDELAQWYMIRGRFLDVTPNTYTERVRVDGLQTPAFRPRSGHWAIEVQACRIYEEEEQCSEWLKSDEKGEPEPWIIYWKPPPTTGVKVEDANGSP